jgi:catechol 2,3-dioxygenase-like lactoylglutathione lyase family enzyme
MIPGRKTSVGLEKSRRPRQNAPLTEAPMQLDHVNIHCDDQEAVRDFLVALLGLKVGWRPGFVEPGYWLYLEDKAVIHTWPRRSPPGAGWVDHIAFGPCGDPGSKRAALQDLGLPFRETRLPDTDIVQFFVTGPENIRIELQCR